MSDGNPLLNDRNVDFLLYELYDAESLCELPYYRDHSRETFELFLGACRKFAREALFPTYRPMDEQPAYFSDGRITAHPCMKQLYPQLVGLGVLNASAPYEVEGQQVPMTVMTLASCYLSAANLSAFGFCMLTAGAAHLIHSFGSEALQRQYMRRMYAGEWTGTMALTEPQAGSSLADIQTKATPTERGDYLITGSKIFISGGDQDFTDNVVHLTLARIEGAPAGTRGISLFVVPKKRWEGDQLVANDVSTAGTFHKLGWRGIPSVALSFGENNDCRGYLVGEPHQGLKYMFQMMNEARIGIGGAGTATASVGYLAALAYAKDRPQGRRLLESATSPPVAIIEHADVRRMLLRQKAIVEGSLALLTATARYFDIATHGQDTTERARAQQLLDLLTPIVKTFPAEKGYEANALAVQVLGGSGYTSEYLPEALLRDQKLNSIHEGTTGIQSLDLLARKVLLTQGQSLMALAQEIQVSIDRAQRAELDTAWIDALRASLDTISSVTLHLGGFGASDPARVIRHSVDYLDMLATAVVGWQWLLQAAVAKPALAQAVSDDAKAFYQGKLKAAQYWFANEMPRVRLLAEIIQTGDDAFANIPVESF